MARPKSEPPVLVDKTEAEIKTASENSASQQLIIATKNQLAKVDEFFGGAYNREANERGLKVDAELMNLSSLSFGGRLQFALEHEGRDYYLDLLQNFNVGERQGAQLRQTFARFHTRPDFSRLAATKLSTLAVLEDDVLEQIEQGSIVDAKISDLDRMTVRELKAKVTELRDETRANKERLAEARASKDDALDKLQLRDRNLENKQTVVGTRFGMLETACMRLLTAVNDYKVASYELDTALEETNSKLTLPQSQTILNNADWIQKNLADAGLMVMPVPTGEPQFGAPL